MLERVTSDLMAEGVDAPDLLRVMVRAVARLRRPTNSGETRRNLVLGVELEQTFSVYELQVTPFLAPSRETRPVRPPLGVVVPEYEKSSRLRAQRPTKILSPAHARPASSPARAPQYFGTTARRNKRRLSTVQA